MKQHINVHTGTSTLPMYIGCVTSYLCVFHSLIFVCSIFVLGSLVYCFEMWESHQPKSHVLILLNLRYFECQSNHPKYGVLILWLVQAINASSSKYFERLDLKSSKSLFTICIYTSVQLFFQSQSTVSLFCDKRAFLDISRFLSPYEPKH